MLNGPVYVSRMLPERTMELLYDTVRHVHVHEKDTPPRRNELLAGISGAKAAITLLTDVVDQELLDAAGPQLRVVANYAVGYDNIDVEAASRRGVVVCNTPGVLDEATADLTVALLLATARRVAEADRWLRSGASWAWSPRLFTGLDVSAGARLGIVGLGRIGRAVAHRARAFGMEVAASTSHLSGNQPSDALDGGWIPRLSLEELLKTSDVVSLHCPLTEATRHLIDANRLALMRPTAILVNTARGPLVDEQALVNALRSGTIAAAGLDVFEQEPRVHPALLTMDNVVLLPHIASAGRATREAMGELSVANVAAVLRGAAPPAPVPHQLAAENPLRDYEPGE